MTEAQKDEIEAINSIYGEDSLVPSDEASVYVLNLPQHDASIRLRYPIDYPDSPLEVLGSQSSGEYTRKGEAARAVGIFRDVLGRLFQPGQVCLFDVIEEVNSTIPSNEEEPITTEDTDNVETSSNSISKLSTDKPQVTQVPLWVLSEVVTELKSVFVARVTAVSSSEKAKLYLQHLLDNDKRVRSATHNITAWRIRGENGVTFQDCNDDGETAAGGRVLHLMQLMDLWDVMVIVTRWYGGHQLGPKRFSIINTVARDAFVKGDFVQDPASKKKGKR